MEYNTELNLYFFVLSLLILTQNGVLSEPQIPCFFIFGDSVVDNGNNNYRDTTAKVDYLPYGIDFPSGPTGRFSNGRNFADFIAELLGFDKYIPPFVNASNEDVLRGLNYGSGGAGIYDETGRDFYGDVIGFNEQLSNHEVTISRITGLLGGNKIAAKQHLSKCIYLVGMGNNDYLTDFLPQFHSQISPFTPEQYAALLIWTYSKQLERLYDRGARKIAVSALGKLGCLPHEIATYGLSDSSSSCVETSNDAVRIFNGFLKLLIKDLNNKFKDADFVFTGDRSPSSFGNIRFVSEPCCKVSTGVGGGHCLPETIPCSNRDEYMFLDGFHPTEAAYLSSAKNAYKDMSPLYVDTPIATM